MLRDLPLQSSVEVDPSGVNMLTDLPSQSSAEMDPSGAKVLSGHRVHVTLPGWPPGW